jgi:hypothetical protein
MSNKHVPPALTAETVFRLIESLPEAEQERLMDMLGLVTLDEPDGFKEVVAAAQEELDRFRANNVRMLAQVVQGQCEQLINEAARMGGMEPEAAALIRQVSQEACEALHEAEQAGKAHPAEEPSEGVVDLRLIVESFMAIIRDMNQSVTEVLQIAQQTIDFGKGLQKRLRDRNASSRNGERDAEIVRLRDEEQLTWGEIQRKLKAHHRWGWAAPETTNTPVTVDAIKQAYRRQKRWLARAADLDFETN